MRGLSSIDLVHRARRLIFGSFGLQCALAVGVAGAQDAGRQLRHSSTSHDGQAQAKRPIEASDIAAWRTIRSATLSRDGKWFGYVLTPNEGSSELIVRRTASDDAMRFSVGDGGGQFAFSADARWVLFLRAPDHEAAKRLREAGQPVRNTLVILELATGRKAEFDNIRNFTLDGMRSRTAVLEPYAPAASTPTPAWGAGRDLLLYDLAGGAQRYLTNVREFAFDPSGRWLAWTVDAGAPLGNGLRLRNLEAGVDRVLDEDRAYYRGLTWAERTRDRLAVLKGVADTARADTLYQLLWYTDLSKDAPSTNRFDPRDDPAFPVGMTIGTTQSLRWAEGQDAIFVGIRPVRREPAREPTPSDEKANVALWHWNEPRLQTQQQVERAQDEAYTYLSIYHLKEKKFVRLADDRLRDVDVAPRARWALGWDTRVYATDNWLTGRHYADLYAVDISTGTRRLLIKRYLLSYGLPGRPKRYFLSPDGIHVLTWTDGAYTVHDMATGASYPLVRKGGPAFGRRSYDYSPHKAPIQPIAWSTDGAVVILSDGWDLWAVSLNRGTPVNLTVNGKRDGIQYGEVASDLMGAEPVIGYNSPTIDLSAPWYVRARAYWRSERGYVRIDGRTPGAHRMLWEEASLSWAIKARDADVVAFTRGTALEYPDYYLTDLAFSKPRRITDANSQQQELRWPSGTMLVDYKGPRGERLQASLLLPANYQKGKRYPAIAMIYERESFRRNSYLAPSGGGGTGVDPTRYASRGYVIIFPDINYVKDRPGTSALHCVLAAVRTAVAAGVVDSTQVGLTGHSWGGYESAFIATQTSFFRAVLAAAPLTDMISAYGGIYWGTGAMQTAHFEADQMRLTKPYWRDLGSYVRESPVFHVDKVTTPILLVHNDRDDAVDWHQGVELYNVMRRARKPIVMLQYIGEGHTTGGRANRNDLVQRAQEFFDHFLMGAPAPTWWVKGASAPAGE